MPFSLPSDPTVLFQGDSITDAGRDRTAPDSLGIGYAALAATAIRAAHPGATALNRGIAGNRLADLSTRWEQDTLAHRPDLLSIMIGVNDTWRYYDSGLASPVDRWEADYRLLLDQVRVHTPGTRLLLIEPFLIPAAPAQWAWREDLDPRIQAVRRIAQDYDALLLAADGLLTQAARTAGDPAAIAPDGVHPSPTGHRILAEAWTALALGQDTSPSRAS